MVAAGPIAAVEAVDLSGVQTVMAFGDSYTVGYWATGFNGYIQQFAAEHSLKLANQAAGGARAIDVAGQVFQHLPAQNPGLVTVMVGLNEPGLRRADPTLTIEKMKGVVRSLLASQFAAEAVPVSSLIGGDAAYGPHVRASSLGGSGRFLTSSNPLTWSFSGTNVVVGFQGGAGYRMGTFTVSIDGVDQVTVNPMAYSDSLDWSPVMPNLVRVTGLANTSHTLRVRVASAPQVILDWVGTLRDPAAVAPAVVLDVAHLSAAGYVAFSAPALGDALIDRLNAGLASVVAEFAGYPVVEAKTNDFYTPATGASTAPHDTYHPNDLGHGQIKAALDAALGETVTPPPAPAPSPVPAPSLSPADLRTDGEHLYWLRPDGTRALIN